MFASRRFIVFAACLAQLLISVHCLEAGTPTAAQALALRPIQKDVEYDRPAGEDKAKCTVKPHGERETTGWVVRDHLGRFLRKFVDTNRDNKVDLWCYYKNGIEVYRDVDSDFNGKADQYRWLGTSGIRWGIDRDEDGRIDSWRMISPEEVTAEVVAALRDRDAGRFKHLLLTRSELSSLGLGAEQAKALAAKIAAAADNFASAARRQNVVDHNTDWVHFGGTRPGVIAAGTNGSKQDILIYDNVTAVVETNGKHAQLAIGTLVRVDDKWRVIDVPRGLADGQPGGFFFNSAFSTIPTADHLPSAGVSEATQKLMTQFQDVERSLASARTAAERAQLNDQRADLLEQLAAAATSDEERENWIRQYAETVSAAIQTGDYPGGLERLKKFHTQLAKSADQSDLVAYVKYRHMNAVYTKSLEDPNVDYAKVQESWLELLREFVEDFPKSDDAADAMLQLALAEEFAGKEDEAKQWYSRIVKDFESSPLRDKAQGAVRRLESVGRSMDVRGRSLRGQAVDLADYRGKVVLVHYWATWCDLCHDEFKILKNLQAKYSRRGFAMIGICLDNERQSAIDFTRSARIGWPQLHEEGGLDGRLATQYGILTLPAMMLVGKNGEVVRRSIYASELDAELDKHLK